MNREDDPRVPLMDLLADLEPSDFYGGYTGIDDLLENDVSKLARRYRQALELLAFMRKPLEERVDPAWREREGAGAVSMAVETARSMLGQVFHPHTGIFGVVTALVLELEDEREARATADRALSGLHRFVATELDRHGGEDGAPAPWADYHGDSVVAAYVAQLQAGQEE